MHENIGYENARDIMLERICRVTAEHTPLSEAFERILAEDLNATEDVPPFDRSPFDGYAIRVADTESASRENPVILRILEEVPAGSVPAIPLTRGTATKILTGSPVPEGADSVIKYEETEFTAEIVKIFGPVTRHDVVRRGEDIKKGESLARKGDKIEPAMAGALASQGISSPLVYRIPRVGIISSGNELAEVFEEISGGQIRDTNRYMLEGEIRRAGAQAVHLGTAKDSPDEVAELIEKGLSDCDMIFLTGGASVGDYDATPKAMELVGAKTVVRGVDMKPGGACVYGIKESKAIFGLSGNPSAAMANFYSVGLPCLRKLTGLREYMCREITVTLAEDFRKKSHRTRLVRGRLDLTDGEVRICFPGQGNAILHALTGCDVLAEIPAGSTGLKARTRLRAYLI